MASPEEEKEKVTADPVEGKRDGKKAVKVGTTPDQAEGDRETIEEEIRRKE